MTKEDIIEKMSEENELPKSKNKKTLNLIINIISNALAEKDKVVLTNFGTFEVAHRNARQVKQIHTKELITIAEHDVVTFRVGKELSEKVNKKYN